MIKLGYMSWKEDYGVQVPFPSPHVKGAYCHHNLSLWMLSLVTWLRYCLSGFFTANLLNFPIFNPHSLDGSQNAQSTFKELDFHHNFQVMFHLLESRICTKIIWNFSAQGICSLLFLVRLFNYYLYKYEGTSNLNQWHLVLMRTIKTGIILKSLMSEKAIWLSIYDLLAYGLPSCFWWLK